MDALLSNVERAREIAATALAAMEANGIPPSPRNYAVWFTHAAGAAPELSGTLEAMIGSKEAFTRQRNDELFVRFIAAEAQASSMQEVGKRLHKSIGKVLEK